MKKARVTLLVITPLFLSGNNHNGGFAEFRLASLKGALRFWFRAANYGKMDLEKKLFGSTETGLGCFMMRANPVQDTARDDFEAQYLLGQGLYQNQKGLTRRYIKPGTRIEIELLFKNSASSSDIQYVLESLFFLTHLGGLGSRSRRGMGSVVVEKIEGDIDTELFAPVQDSASLITKLERFAFSKINGSPQGLPDYTAFSRGTRILVLDKSLSNSNSSWEKCLNWLNREFMNFRSNLRHPKRFSRDMSMMFKFVKTGSLDTAPSRVTFGLPHNYFFRNLGSAQTKEVRRASPLLFHIHQTHSRQYVPIISFLPAVFLPEDTRITYQNNKSIKASVSSPNSFKPIHDFLDEIKKYGQEIVTGLTSNGGGKE